METKAVFYDKLTFIYLEMPKFNKTVEELETRFDKWLYVIRNLNRLDKVPDKLRERVFEKLFETAEIARFTPDQVRSYEDSLKYYRDMKNSLDTAKEEGLMEGKEAGREQREIEIAKTALKMGLSVNDIMQLTGLNQQTIEQIKTSEE